MIEAEVTQIQYRGYPPQLGGPSKERLANYCCLSDYYPATFAQQSMRHERFNKVDKTSLHHVLANAFPHFAGFEFQVVNFENSSPTKEQIKVTMFGLDMMNNKVFWNGWGQI